MKKKSFLFFFLLVFILPVLGQDTKIDSLKLALKNAKHDTTRCNILALLIEEESDITIWPKYNEQLKTLTEKGLKKEKDNKIRYVLQKHFANSLGNTGYLYDMKGFPDKSIECYTKSLNIQKTINNKNEQATLLNNIGFVYFKQGNITNALKYYSSSLKIQEEINDKDGMSFSLNNIGGVYQNQDDKDKALEYYLKSLKIREELGDKRGIAMSLNNIGYIYDCKKNFSKALQYYETSLKFREEINDKDGMANALSNIGSIYNEYNDTKKALGYYLKSLEIKRDIEDKQGMANAMINIGYVYLHNKNYSLALKYAIESMVLCSELGFPFETSETALLLNAIYKATDNYKLALQNFELYIQMRDSINNEETKKASIKSQFKYEYEKKATADSVKVAEEKKVVAVQLKQEKTQRFALYGGLALVLVFAVFMFNRFRVTQKQKNIIELKEKETQQQNEIITIQKHLVEEKHKEITDSINYAERIQRSFLATKELLDENLSSLRGGAEGGGGYFVFFKPKDVVSGDFYWSDKLSNGNFALATADSTGHGVPGAIMSLLNVTSLEKAIEQHTDPADILNHTRQTIIERLKKDGSEEGGKDGMDCSLLVFDFTNKQLLIAAANNPVWIIRSNSPFEGGVRRTGDVELIEIKPDKMPVGKSDKQDQSFTTHTLELQKGDTIYTLTDGFPDQFGGDKGKKFMSKKLKELLLANVHLPITQQKELLDSTFTNWVGDLEQVDDVTVIGIKV